ncbi:MAG TPA: hypothetical protein VHE33_01250 [Acidobacteriaceae bacterium]|nr:hypothetical protein [Acidobacteriaceae bacterium]
MALAAPLPTVAARPRSRLWGVPIYWHLLSLDAPTVAVLWAWSFASAAHLRIPFVSIAVLGVGTWLIYIADRLLDVRSPSHPALRERHFFHERHRRVLFLVSPVVGALLLGLICAMPPAARRDDTILFAISMLYFGGVHLPALRVRRWFPREVAVGILFALATAVPAWSAPDSKPQLAWFVLLFAGLCTLNCIAIETWERSSNTPRSMTVSAMAICAAVASIALLTMRGHQLPGEFAICASAFTSAALLFALDGVHRRWFSRSSWPEDRRHFLLALRVAADAALLTPLFFLSLWHL